MIPEGRDKTLLAITRSKAKMYEYRIPEPHINLSQDPQMLLDLAIGILGDVAATGETGEQSLDYSTNPLLFSAHYFDALQNSRLSPGFDAYLRLTASAAYSLCGIPGSAVVLAKAVPHDVDLDARGLDRALRALLADEVSGLDVPSVAGSPYSSELARLKESFQSFLSDGTGSRICSDAASQLRWIAYHGGSDRELLLSDAVKAVVDAMLLRSTWLRLPEFTGIPVKTWRPILRRRNFIRELWPSQILLGEHGVFEGRSAVVQMPTSAGKTKATELIIRSAFLANRARLCVIVAPFRALCHEIHHSLARQMRPDGIDVEMVSDVLQMDVELTDRSRVLVVTPEKLDFLLRHEAPLAGRIDVLIFDEAHLFDDGARGTAYELLLTSLKLHVRADAQKVLISAVIRNAEDIRDWLLGSNGEIVSSGHILPTYRTVGFVSWKAELGQIQFVDPTMPRREQFFVPRVISPIRLNLHSRERNEQFFPERNEPRDIALYLGCRLVTNGSVAIFCGRKDTAAWFGKRIVDVEERGGLLETPSAVCDAAELRRLVYQHTANLGAESWSTQAATKGILLHHGNTPHGLRLAVEHAVERGDVRLVVCTSTLAQGVNLPLRYLIVTGMHQGRERIRVRDFHNLMGRAGRAGKYTEGSVLFSNPSVFDQRANGRESWRWDDATELLDPDKSEPCKSMILTLFSPYVDKYGNPTVSHDVLWFAQLCFENAEELSNLAGRILQECQRQEDNDINNIRDQIRERERVLRSVEAFLLQYTSTDDQDTLEESIQSIAAASLAHFQATPAQQSIVCQLFSYIGRRILAQTPDPNRRAAFARTILSAHDCAELVEHLASARTPLEAAQNAKELYEIFWPFLRSYTTNSTLAGCSEPQAKAAGLEWVQGGSFAAIYAAMDGARIGRGRRYPTIENAVDLAENGLGYEGALIVGAACELLPIADIEEQPLRANLTNFQKVLRYGIPDNRSIGVYELGFADRCLAQEITVHLPASGDLRRAIISNQAAVGRILENYPSYFERQLADIIG